MRIPVSGVRYALNKSPPGEIYISASKIFSGLLLLNVLRAAHAFTRTSPNPFTSLTIARFLAQVALPLYIQMV